MWGASREPVPGAAPAGEIRAERRKLRRAESSSAQSTVLGAVGLQPGSGGSAFRLRLLAGSLAIC